MSRVKVFFTVDVEVWPGAWTDIDARFPQAFRSYVYGDTPFGQYGLPLTLRVLQEHGLKGVFFVEPLFSSRFGLEPLQEIIGLINEADQEVQLHLHTEWVDEACTPLLDWTPKQKIQHLSGFSLRDQEALIGWGKRRVVEAGAEPVTAFRAGSFVFNRDTLKALEANEVYIDSSYNHYFGGLDSGIWDRGSRSVPVQPFKVGGVVEFPVTVYRDLPLHVRPLQLKACSLAEMTSVLRKAADNDHSAVVVVSHNFELIDRRDFSRDETVARRFVGLCEFLSRHRDVFETSGFNGVACEPQQQQPQPVTGTMVGLAIRYFEQAKRRL